MVPGSPPSPTARGRCAHTLLLHDTEAFLVSEVAAHVGRGLAEDAVAIVLASPPRRAGLRAALGGRGVDVEAAVARGDLRILDAADTLRSFTTADGPSARGFDERIGSQVARAARSGRPVLVHDEMGALLWRSGEPDAALLLEDLWNDLAMRHPLDLLCAHPLSAFDAPGTSAAFARLCDAHRTVVPGEEHARADEDGRARMVARLQREVRVRGRALAARAVGVDPAAGSGAPEPTGDDRPCGIAELTAHLPAFLTALCAGDTGAAAATLGDVVAAGARPAETFDGFVAPAMHEIGRRWERGALDAADEHLATLTCEHAIACVYPALLRARPGCRERVLVAGVEGEAHALAPRFVADVLAADGYDVVHLGPGVPAAALGAAVARHLPAVVALSMTLVEHAPALVRCLSAIADNVPRTPVLLGGQGIDATWALDGWPVATSAHGARHEVARLVAERPPMPRVRTPAPPAWAAVPAVPDPAPDDLGEVARRHALAAHSFRLLAAQDDLTGLLNRRAFGEHLAETVVAGRAAMLLAADVDGLKAVNDAEGHAAGDALIVAVGRAIREGAGPDLVAARLGGDEFAVLVPGSERDAIRVADRVRASLARDTPGASVSVGIARVATDARAAALDADRALYAAKAAGRDRVALWPGTTLAGPPAA